MNDRCVKLNSIVCSLFLLQYTFLMPVMLFVNSTLAVAVFSFCLLLVLLLKNGFSVNQNIFIFYLFFLLVITTKVFISESAPSAIVLIVLFTLPASYIMCYQFDYDTFMHYSIKVSRLCFLLICWNPFTSGFDYMRFGYGMLPVVIFCYLDLIHYLPRQDNVHNLNTYMDIAIAGLGAIEILIYGARGSLLALILFLALERFAVNKFFSIKNTLLISAGLITILMIVPILDMFEKVAKQIGIYSYSITKFKMQLSGGFVYAASGRDILYEKSIAKIKEHPLLGGKIIMDESGTYAHNLFLQVAQDLGIVFLILLIVFLIYVLYKIFSKKSTYNEKIILSILFAISIGRLLFSSTVWRRPEFWMLVCFTLAMKGNRQIQKE